MGLFSKNYVAKSRTADRRFAEFLKWIPRLKVDLKFLFLLRLIFLTAFDASEDELKTIKIV